MRIRQVVNRAVRARGKGLHVEGGINAVVAANVNEKSARTTVSSRQRTQREGGRKA